MNNSRAKKGYTAQIPPPPPLWTSDDQAAPEEGAQESLVPLSQIHLPAKQPRNYFDPESLRQLAESIAQHGILQPLLVRPLAGGGYELVAGERRYRAATELGLTEVPVVVKELTDEAAWQLALIENLHREDLNSVEETEGILQLLALRLGIAVPEVSPLLHRLQKERKNNSPGGANNVIGQDNLSGTESANNVIGKTETTSLDVVSPELQKIETLFRELGLMTWESFVNNRLPLLNLPQNIIWALTGGKIAYTKAKVIAGVKDEERRDSLLKEAIEQQLSLSQIKEKIRTLQAKSQLETSSLAERMKTVYHKVKKNAFSEDLKKRQQIEDLLTRLEKLIE